MDLFHGGLLPPRKQPIPPKGNAGLGTLPPREHKVTHAWQPTVQNCDQYMSDRTGKYEYRAMRYRHTIDWLMANGLDNTMTLFDVGAGMTEFDYTLRAEYGWRGRYIPVDGGIDGTDLETWKPKRDAHFFVALELLEHIYEWPMLLSTMKNHATIGVAISTPDPETTDVLGMDSTHVSPIYAGTLEAWDMQVSRETFYGGVFSDGKPDSLFATWRRNE